ncbi:hypothetical protein HDU80_001741 [Chytriomyces hyalinus]|nr:hypothetical protein HDU80_001741 [Chytriomyces hyalinus]
MNTWQDEGGTCGLEALEHHLYVVQVVLFVVREDEYVIDVDNEEDVKEVLEDCAEGGLENTGGISKAKMHYNPFIVAVLGAEGSFRDVRFYDPDLMETGPTVHLGEELSFGETVTGF